MKIIMLLMELISLGWIIGYFAQVPGVEIKSYKRLVLRWKSDSHTRRQDNIICEAKASCPVGILRPTGGCMIYKTNKTMFSGSLQSSNIRLPNKSVSRSTNQCINVYRELHYTKM